MDTQPPLNQSGHESKTTHKVVRWLVREFMGTVTMAVILFLTAGRLDWMAGWALVIITALWVIATALVVIPRYPELLAERVGPKKGTKTWDTILLSIYGLVTIVRYVVAGLDVRYGWTTGISAPVQIVALIIAALGYGLVVWATGTNAYFSQTARIQTERGHRVVTSGPYHFVRHPGYIGMILFELASAIMLGSWWALLLSGVSTVLFIIRTALEDKMLHDELQGYTDFAQQTRYRLIPGIW
jgi:protein-S-isoprenylcysteine O-methyltransferase Ste14